MGMYAVALEHLAVHRAVAREVAHQHSEVREYRRAVVIPFLDGVAVRYEHMYPLGDETRLGYSRVLLAHAVLIYDAQLDGRLRRFVIDGSIVEPFLFVVINISDSRRHQLREKEVHRLKYRLIAAEVPVQNNLRRKSRIVPVIQNGVIFSL